MMKTLFVKPIEGAILPNPDRRMLPLAADGEHVPDNVFWQRRIAAGDVTREAAPEPEAGPEAAGE